ncbi:Hypothetical predicted protein [Mytilus galloprovincialis]|uniref:Uncharacterized protein n=1 Tax=Mytilus galloprovincialis TaxID=29158 RepID=A0A8B6E996_MYTGA|nr:Hypothetical predicted protein [Mytilus galloprovincialis]
MSESGQNIKKKNTDECLVCSKPPYQSKKISSKLLDFSIKDLILRYGGISKDKGVICRNCERRLETLHGKQFYDECQSAARKQDFTTPVVCNKSLPTSPLIEGRKQWIWTLMREIQQKYFNPVKEWSKDYQVIGNFFERLYVFPLPEARGSFLFTENVTLTSKLCPLKAISNSIVTAVEDGVIWFLNA